MLSGHFTYMRKPFLSTTYFALVISPEKHTLRTIYVIRVPYLLRDTP